MRVAATVALIATLLSWIPALNIVLWVAAGFAAVYLYRRRTRAFLNIRAGVGWAGLRGVLMFVITTVIFTPYRDPGSRGQHCDVVQTAVQECVRPNVQEALRMLETGPGLATILLATLFMLFCFIAAGDGGGALGAKMVSRRRGRVSLGSPAFAIHHFEVESSGSAAG